MTKRPGPSAVGQCLLALVLALGSVATYAQPGPPPAPQPPPNPQLEQQRLATVEDHRQMLQQLGIQALRPGPSGNESAPNHANYDEALANPFPKLPELLTLRNGRKVTKADAWWKQRRPELVEDFEREVVGRLPANVPNVTWSVVESASGTIGGRPVNGRQVVGHVDNAAHPAITVDIQMMLVTPANASGPVPVMIMFRGGTLPQAVGMAPMTGFGGRPLPPPAPGSDPPATEQLIAAGWGYAFLNPSSIQADNGAGLTQRHHRSGQQGPAAQAGRLGLAARVGVGRGACARLPRNRSHRRRQARRDRRRLALRQGGARHDGLRAAIRRRPGRLVRRGRRQAASPQLR